ncbi:MAG: hypothetical protein IPG84_18790 [Betaproteobacteria bacterium]|nr:hypothetical protein [Betaproteobacteria bacterium]
MAAYVAEIAWIVSMLLIFSSGFAGFSAGAALFVLASAAVQLVKAVRRLAIVVVILQGGAVVGRARRSAIGPPQRAHVPVPAAAFGA